jgi:hypothetical protein
VSFGLSLPTYKRTLTCTHTYILTVYFDDGFDLHVILSAPRRYASRRSAFGSQRRKVRRKSGGVRLEYATLGSVNLFKFTSVYFDRVHYISVYFHLFQFSSVYTRLGRNKIGKNRIG